MEQSTLPLLLARPAGQSTQATPRLLFLPGPQRWHDANEPAAGARPGAHKEQLPAVPAFPLGHAEHPVCACVGSLPSGQVWQMAVVVPLSL